MSLVLGAPLALLALLALALPLLLHLDRRRTPRRLVFPALRWLGRAQPVRRRARLTEWLLLSLRLALLIVLAAWLAEPAVQGWTGAPRQWVAVAPGVPPASLPKPGAGPARTVWLSEGFPALTATGGSSGDTASLLRELDASLGPDDELTVVVPRELGGLDAAAIALSRRVTWHVVDGASPGPAAMPQRRLGLAVRHTPETAPALRWIRAAATAWNAVRADAVVLDVAPIGTALPQASDALLWLGAPPDATALQRVRAGATLLEFPFTTSPGAAAGTASWEPVARRVGRGWHRTSQQALDPAALPSLHEAGFPHRLHDLLFGAPPPPARADAADVRPLAAARPLPPPAVPLRSWLAWAAALLFLCERTLANGRRLGRSA
jgi:hypothetical protein